MGHRQGHARVCFCGWSPPGFLREKAIGTLNITRRSLLTAIGAVIVFGCIFAAGFYATRAALPDVWRERYYLDAKVLRYYFGSVVVLGAVPVLFGLYRLGLVFIGGALAGWLTNCVMIATLDPPRPTMQPAVYNFFIVVAGALVAVAMEVAYRVRRRRKESAGTPASSSS